MVEQTVQIIRHTTSKPDRTINESASNTEASVVETEHTHPIQLKRQRQRQRKITMNRKTQNHISETTDSRNPSQASATGNSQGKLQSAAMNQKYPRPAEHFTITKPKDTSQPFLAPENGAELDAAYWADAPALDAAPVADGGGAWKRK
jgi:hypothetical protein